jgi:hypothetical protein
MIDVATGLDLHPAVIAARDEIIIAALEYEQAGDNAAFVRMIRLKYPLLSRGQLADAFSAAGDALRGFGGPPWLTDGRGLDDTFDDAAWHLLSRGWPVFEVRP